MVLTDNTEKVLSYIDAFIYQQEQLIEKAKAARDFFVTLGEAAAAPYQYQVASRSGGKPHLVSVSKDEITCTCPAGSNGRKCWAMKGIEGAVRSFMNANLGKSGGFYDDTFTYRAWTRIDVR